MKTMSAMEVRRHFGSVLDEVRIKSERIILERAGNPIAMIVPIESSVDQDQRKVQLQFIEDNAGSGCKSTRSEHVDQWISEMREDRHYG